MLDFATFLLIIKGEILITKKPKLSLRVLLGGEIGM
jgi:hypothetical protein